MDIREKVERDSASGLAPPMQGACRDESEVATARDLKALRKQLKQSQTEFWARFGVTQSRGSRYEKGLFLPHSVAILVELYVEKKVNDTDLLAALRNCSQHPAKPVDLP